MAMNGRPLDGIRVLDLTNMFAGPFCTYQLALLGAEVIKIERPGRGDLARRHGPVPELNEAGLGVAFLSQNAGKKSLELDVRTEDGERQFLELVANSDVLVENLRPGALGKYGFPWERLRGINSGLVYCAITGFGQTGPMSVIPAYDQVIQGLSGMMTITGRPGDGPLRVGFPVCDSVAGLNAALGVVAALQARERTGEGCHLDVSMLECSVAAMTWEIANWLHAGVAPGPMGDQNPTAAPSGTFRTGDGLLNIACNSADQFTRLCRVLGRDDLVTDERFGSGDLRKCHREALNSEIGATLAQRPAPAWEKELQAAGVPAARILDIAEAVELDQLDHRGFFADLKFPPAADGVMRGHGAGLLFDQRPLPPTGPPPELGEHNASIAEWLASVSEGAERE
jgi:crotonobetainyl-CoA:carnitine CoA-transferase CaiB-like acyl-CoA transferase